MKDPIAIVGMACRYPDADSPRALWENVLAGRRAFRRMPRERLDLDDYFSEDPAAPDGIYCTQAAVLEGYEFDRVRFKVSGSSFRRADMSHWLALEVASDALRDAGFPDGDGLPRESTGVLLGNTLTGEFSRAALMRLRWPFVRRVLARRLGEHGLKDRELAVLLSELETDYKAPFPPLNEESLAGGLSNTIAGRICNHFDLAGGGYTLDGACSSSLLALSNACAGLAAGDLDVALAGGVDLSLDPFELIGFARTGALSRTRMRVYDRDSDGFWPGEGCGFVVLMRHQDALARGLRCYALINGWGISSDGSGGITRPEARGQGLAMQRAYRRAGYSIQDVTLFEGHGTGTQVGDAVELAALIRARVGAPTRATLGSIKANIGHTKAAAGAAGLIKTVMALHHQILPPATGVEHPNPALAGPDSTLRLLEQGEPWPRDLPLRAGVSSFGFGGIDVHLTLEGSAAVRRQGLTDHDRRLVASHQDTELFFLRGRDRDDLAEQAATLAALAGRLSLAELTDLAAHLAGRADAGPWRAAAIAGTPARLEERLEALHDWLQEDGGRLLDPAQGVFFSPPGPAPRIGLLFSGQASPVRLTGGAMARRFPAVAELYREAELAARDDGTTVVAQPAIVAAERACLALLEHLGIEASVGLGHSLGEYTALHWAGAFDGPQLQCLARLRGRLMAEVPGPRGAMAAILASGDQVQDLLSEGVVVSCFNSPAQTVVSGVAEAVDWVTERARSEGLRVTPLPVTQAFHSPLMEPAVEELEESLARVPIQPLRRPVISSVTGTELRPDADLSALLQRQMTSTVHFTEALNQMGRQVDLCLEVGPGQVLSGLAEETLDLPVFPLDGAGASLAPFFAGVAAAYALGAPLRRFALFEDRLTRPFDPDREPRFLANPCESVPREEGPAPSPGASAVEIEPATPGAATAQPVDATVGEPNEGDGPDALELLRRLVADKAELPVSTVSDDSRLLVDLHLNSISVGQLVAEAARRLGLAAPASPTDYAQATLVELARALEEQRALGGGATEPEPAWPPGVDQWVHGFQVLWREQPLPATTNDASASGTWRLFHPSDISPPKALPGTLATLPGSGCLVWLPPGPPQAGFDALRRAVATLLEENLGRLVLVQEGVAAAPLVRTLHLEYPEHEVCILDLPDDGDLPRRIQGELAVGYGCHEVRHDPHGRRLLPVLEPLSLPEPEDAPPLGPDDVLLVSGGGKGIAAECALDLARSTGVRLALVGRSEPASDTALAENLARFEAHGVTWRYYAADVSDAGAVGAVVARCRSELGEVTGILHGAGRNRPRLLLELEPGDLEATLAPKLAGLDNLLASLDPGHLRLLVGFGSIIARSGMRGEADYALANEALARRLEAFQADHASCRCLCVEWSIWSGVGMGERLGRVDTLLREGITPISPDQGVAWMRRLLDMRNGPVRVVVSGRLGDLPTLRLARPDLPMRRFLDPVRVYYPGIELVVEPELSDATDPYLADHALDGEPLFPAVMGLEAMAQVGMALAGTDRLPRFSRVELLHPVAVSPHTQQRIRIAALMRDPDRVDVVLRSEVDGFQQDHFRARCHFSQDREPLPGVEVPEREPPELEPERDVYAPLLFHHGRFRRITAYRHLAAESCIAAIGTGNGAPWFAGLLPPGLVLGDPGSRDAALHAIQACIPQSRLLPVGADGVRFGDPECAGPWQVRAREIAREGDQFTYHMELRGRDGTLREAWTGLRFRRVAPIEMERWPAGLLAPHLERRFAELGLGEIAVAVRRKDGEPRHVHGKQTMQHALGDDTLLLYRPDGRPEAVDGRPVSASHAGELTLAVTGPTPVSCDLEPVQNRAESVWQDLLGAEHLLLAELLSRSLREALDQSATRVWGAKECLKKSGAMPGTPLVLAFAEADGWAVLEAGNWRIASGLLAVRDLGNEMAVTLLREGPHAVL